MQVLNYKFDILGNFSSKMKEMVAGTKELGSEVKGTQDGIIGFCNKLASYDWGISSIKNSLSGLQEPIMPS